MKTVQDKNLLEMPIGVFDSGMGGLTVMREIMRQIPNEKVIYFGDTARVPYGSKSKETVTRFSRQIVRFLQSKQVKAIVVACNTASAYALNDLEREIDIPIIGVVKPGAKVAAEVTRNGQVGVIATEGTISSNIYTTYIRQLRPEVQVTGKACPLFVPLVEEGLWQDPVTDEIAKRYLSSLIDTGIDTLILGCTHYPLIRSTVAKVMGDHVTLVNPAYETARELKELLMEKGLFNPVPPQLGTNKYEFFVSDGRGEICPFCQFDYQIRHFGRESNTDRGLLSMTKDVVISVRGLQVMDNESAEDIETVQQGEYFERNGSIFLLYDEYYEGFDEPVKNVMKIRGNEMTLTKRGIINVQMNFEAGKKNLTRYQTPYGVMMIGLDTSRVVCLQEEKSLAIEIDYTLEANYQYVSDSKIRIMVRERKQQA